jgi:hypothetical protein
MHDQIQQACTCEDPVVHPDTASETTQKRMNIGAHPPQNLRQTRAQLYVEKLPPKPLLKTVHKCQRHDEAKDGLCAVQLGQALEWGALHVGEGSAGVARKVP